MRTFTRIVIWLGLMAAFTLLAMGLWYLVSGGSQSTESLKWLQFMQTVGTFLLPALLGAWIWSEGHKPIAWLKLNKSTSRKNYLLAVVIMVCAIPAINLLADINSHMDLPESLDFIEQKMQAMEEAAAALTERFLQADNMGVMIVNIGLMAFLPAFTEEISFRGTLQQVLCSSHPSYVRSQTHYAVWITAIIFSAIHMQFYGFVPRMLMGAMFGYVFVWTGTLWIPIVMHFTNNSLAVLGYYFFDEIDENGKNIADTIGAGDTWWLGVLSLMITCLGLLIFYRRTHIRESFSACGYQSDAEQES